MSRELESRPGNLPPGEAARLSELLCAIRSRLNVIGTTMYLLEESLALEKAADKRYFSKMKKEMETVRRLINR